MKSRLISVGIIIALIILCSSPMMLTRVGAESYYDVTVNWLCYTQTQGNFMAQGLVFINVDGNDYTYANLTAILPFYWQATFSHTLTAYDYVYDGPHGYVYNFTGWSNLGNETQSYTVVGTATVTANYETLWAGDVLGKHIVDIYDALAFASAFGATPTSPNYNRYCDYLHTGVIDIFDAIILASNFGKTGP